MSTAGYENIEEARKVRAMLVFNHVSYADGIILGTYFLPCGLCKASIADIPFFGTFARVCCRSFCGQLFSSLIWIALAVTKFCADMPIIGS